MGTFQPPSGRALDLLCLGRAGVDLYAVQRDTDLEDVTQFHKSVGGSPANIATAFARLGGRSGVISLVADDGLGRSVTKFLASNGVDTSQIRTARERELTSLALTEIRPEGCQVIIYRSKAADLQLNEADIDPAAIAASRILLVTGTALSVSPSREAALKAIALAREAGTAVVLDLDYRPYGWNSTAEAAEQLLKACGLSDLVIGNVEEFAILRQGPVPADHGEIARDLFGEVCRTVIVKNGARGCQVFGADGLRIARGVYSVQALKPMGSGDAFAGALLWALCAGKTWPQALEIGAAAAAINVSRDRCAEAMPTRAELESFMSAHALQEYPS